MEGPLEEVVEDCQLLLGLRRADVTDVHFTEELNGNRSTREILRWQGTGFQDPGKKEIERREIWRKRRCGLVVGGHTKVGIQLAREREGQEKEGERERGRGERRDGNWWLAGCAAGKSTCVCECLGHNEAVMAEFVIAD